MATASVIINPECSICLGILQTPKVLPCGHTFCLECVQSHIGNNKETFCCPMCQQDIKIPEGGPHKFITNFIIQTSSDQPLSTVQQKCPNHKQKDIDYFCNNCNVGVCSKCILNQHKDHDTLDIECAETRKKTIEKLQHSQTIIQNKIKDLEKTHSTLLKTYEQLKFWCEDSCAKITEKTEKIISDLRKSCEDTKRDIRNNLAENKLKLEKGKKVTQQIDKLKTQSNIPSETSTLNILQSFPQIKELEKLCQSLKVQLPKIQYKKWQENNVKFDISILGSVIPCEYDIPSMYQFRFDINDMKDVDENYYSKDKLHYCNSHYLW